MHLALGALLSGLALAQDDADAQAQDEPEAVEEEETPLTFDLNGYYRARVYHFNGLYSPDLWPNEPGTGRYTQHRLRLAPTVNYKDKASFTFMADLFDDSLYGDNADRASTPLFAEQPSLTNLDGTENPVLAVKWAWMDFDATLGRVRIGRQPSHWGMGLLANDGDGFRNTWGEAHGGSIFDRFLFATKPVSVFRGISGKEGYEPPLFFIFALDRLVEDPLTQYYGYKCSDDPEDEDDARCEDGDDHSFTEGRDAAARPDNWWTEHDDDVIEFVYALLYKGEELDWGGHEADLMAGFYAVNRRQLETRSNVWIYDAYAKLDYRGIYFETEALTINGDSAAITLPDYDNPDDPLLKRASVQSVVGRLGYTMGPAQLIFESGFASGDDYAGDATFTGRAIHPDYNVGLLLYEEVIARVSALRFTQAGRGLWSGGGVYNSVYMFPSVTYNATDNIQLVGAYLVAFPHKPDGAVILTDDVAEDRALGWEADLAVKARLHEHVLLSFEGGYGQVSDRLPVADLGLTNEGRVWTLQGRAAYQF
ncbi:MAG: hypothetical protein H6740_23930 [Alphaproteobacteria bacterium]|nr:hypothetical protein [Alphaproteobacteria bacterium]